MAFLQEREVRTSSRGEDMQIMALTASQMCVCVFYGSVFFFVCGYMIICVFISIYIYNTLCLRVPDSFKRLWLSWGIFLAFEGSSNAIPAKVWAQVGDRTTIGPAIGNAQEQPLLTQPLPSWPLLYLPARPRVARCPCMVNVFCMRESLRRCVGGGVLLQQPREFWGCTRVDGNAPS